MRDRDPSFAEVRLRLHSWASFRRLYAPGGMILLICLWAVMAAVSDGGVIGTYSLHDVVLLCAVTYLSLWAMYLLVSPGRRRLRLTHALIVHSTILMSIGAIELVTLLTALDWRKYILPYDQRFYYHDSWMNPRNSIDRDLLYIHRPNQRFVGENAGSMTWWLGSLTDHRYAVDVSYDRMGFRNAIDFDQADVVVIGDSFVESPLVPQTQTLSSVLSRDLTAHTANLGHTGYGPLQELIVLTKYGLPLNPKLVLWLFYEGNDLADTVEYQRRITDWDAYVQEYTSFRQRSFVRNAVAAARLLLTSSEIPAPDSQEAYLRTCYFTAARTEEDSRLYLGRDSAPRSEAARDTIDVAHTAFTDAYHLSKAQRASFLLVYVPTKFRVYRDLCEFPEGGYGRTWGSDDLPTQIEQVSQHEGIPFLNLTDALRRAAGAGELVFFADDAHWNSRGIEVAAAAIVARLREDAELAQNWTPR